MSRYKPFMKVGTGLWALDKGAGMIELNLLDTLVAELKKIFTNYQLPAKSGLLQNVKVFAQYMPQPSSVEFAEDSEEDTTPQGYSATDIEENFPCIVVKLDDTQIKEENTLDAMRINVRLLIGTYDEATDCQGYRDVLNIIEKTQQYLLTLPNRVLDGRYILKMPMQSYLFDEQPFPNYFGQIEAVWETARPLMPNYYGITN